MNKDDRIARTLCTWINDLTTASATAISFYKVYATSAAMF